MRSVVMVFVALGVVTLASVATAEDAKEPRGIISLRDALALALLQNPELQGRSWQSRAAEARVLQAGRRPNPEAGLTVEDVLGSGSFQDGDEAQYTLQLSQLVELGGKRSARVDAASRAREVSSLEQDAKREEILAETAHRFIRVLARQDALALANAGVELGETTLRVTRRRVAAGAESSLEEKKATTALARARIDAEHAAHELRVARHELASFWGGDAPEFESVEGRLLARPSLSTYEALAARLDSAPETLRSLSEIELRQAEIRLAEARRVPDVTVAGGARWLEGPGDHAFVFGLSVPLPLTDRNQGGREEAHAQLRGSEAAAKATRVRLRALLFGLYQELLHADTALDAYEREIVPGAEESLTLSRNGFAEGRFSYLDLADAQRTLVQMRKEQIETAASYHRFVVDIERIIGGPIDEAKSRPQAPASNEAGYIR